MLILANSKKEFDKKDWTIWSWSAKSGTSYFIVFTVLVGGYRFSL